MMRICVLETRLNLPGVHSLKQKRGIIKGLLSRIRNRFEVAAAEVAHQDSWQVAGLGFACVGTNVPKLQSRMNNVVNYIDNSGTALLADYQVEVL
ncbi:MAG: DUF503 domain-containing protein [Magnetococcales bacterium]|nr:DUF503 domain-containing protein [Magnetococcales bacterium]